MIEQELVQQGFDLLLFGMGTVFVFLSLLVVSTIAMSGFINRFFPELAPEPLAPTKNSASSGEIPPALRKAIELAIAQHRTK